MNRWTGGNPPVSLTADVVAISRALLAGDTAALDALLDADADLTALLLAACWLVIACHRSVLGDDPAAIDAALADLQAQFRDLIARQPDDRSTA